MKHASLFLFAIPFFFACSSGPKVVDFPDTASVSQEMTSLRRDINQAQQNQVDVLSPHNFQRAWASMEDAKKKADAQDEREDVLHEIAVSRAYLTRAQETADRIQPLIPEVTRARSAALEARALIFQPQEMARADEDLRDVTEDMEDGDEAPDMKSRADLQNQFLDIELRSIRLANIGEAGRNIEAAKNDGAEKYAPRTLAEAEAAYREADTAITTDRHNQMLIGEKSMAANAAAKRLTRVLEIAQEARTGNPEEVALAQERRDETIRGLDRRLDTESAAAAGAIQRREQEIAQRERELRTRDREIAATRETEEAFTHARALFTPGEAEVYRDGDRLLLRLRGLRFPSGRADLPGQNIALLSKVREAIEGMNAERIEIQGHTDSTGSREKNLELSHKRAEAVANFLRAENVTGADQIVTRGYGFDAPIASNKTAEGRAQNRRVDVVVTPARSRDLAE